MTAVDTNVIVRALTGDDVKQTLAAESLLASDEIWIAKTVLLEAAWVLRRSYGFADERVLAALVDLLGWQNVHTEDKWSVAAALDLAGHGVEFADALHLFSRPAGVGFASFDKELVQRAQRAGVPNVAPVR